MRPATPVRAYDSAPDVAPAPLTGTVPHLADARAAGVDPELRQRLAADPDLGLGGAWWRALEACPDPHRPVLVSDRPVRDRDGAPRLEWSLAALVDLADAWAAWYVDLGVRPRDRVAVWIEDSFDDQVQLAALGALGAIPVLLNGRLPARHALDLVRRTGAVGIYTDAAHADAVRAAGELPVRWVRRAEEVGPLGDRRPPDGSRFRHLPEDPVVICHSSGTTGNPKPVIWSHRQGLAGVKLRLAAPEPAGVALLSAVPQSHTSAVAFTTYSLLGGVPVIAWSDPAGPAVARAVARYRPSRVLAFSQTYADLATMDLDPAWFSSVSEWHNTGDSAHDAHIRKLLPLGHRLVDGEVRTGSVFSDGLGSSEMGWAALRRVITDGDQLRPRWLGRPVPLGEVTVLRPDGTPAGTDEPGLLAVRGDTVGPGYWNDSDTYYRSLLGGYWLSGDVVHRTADGDFYHLDRAVDVVRTGGRDGFSLLMEEELLSALPEAADCAVVAGRDGDRVVAVGVVRLTGRTPDPAELLRRANAALAAAGQPTLGVLDIARDGDELPVGSTGKVLKYLLRERYADLPGYLAGRDRTLVAVG